MTEKTQKLAEIVILAVFTLAIHAAVLSKAFPADAPSSFALPPAGQTAIWEAEKANVAGGWEKASRQEASGGAYMASTEAGQNVTLEFAFDVDAPTAVQVFPLWWRHGEQKPAVRFPYNVEFFKVPQVWPVVYADDPSGGPASMGNPIPEKPNGGPHPFSALTGPDVMDYFEGTLFFSAPESGKVGVLNIATEKLLGVIDIGGWPADLVVDRERGLLLVADATNDRIRIFDAKTHQAAGEIAVAAFPRSLLLRNGTLYVACMTGKAILVIDLPSRTIKKTIALPIIPQHVEFAGQPERLVAWVLPSLFDGQTMQPVISDRLVFRPAALGGTNRRSLRGNRRGFDLKSRITTLEWNNNELGMEYKVASGYVQGKIDTRAVTGVAKSAANLPSYLPNDPSPDAACAAENTFFFTSPSTGNVGVHLCEDFSPAKAIHVGGYLSDMVAFSGKAEGFYIDCFGFQRMWDDAKEDYPENTAAKPKVYVADAIGKRIVVIDPKGSNGPSVVKEIPMPGQPIMLSVYGFEVFAVCVEPSMVVAIRVDKDEISKKGELPAAEPSYLMAARYVPYIASARNYAPRESSPWRLAVEHRPLAFDEQSLAPVRSPDLPLLYQRRTTLNWTGSQGKGKSLLVDNLHTIWVDGKRWVDTSAVTDRYLGADDAMLGKKDSPGTITVSLDGGPEYDWTRNLYTMAENRSMLAGGSEEFMRYNAPRWPLKTGKHVLRIRAASPFARLDGLRIERSLQGLADLEFRSPHYKYQGMFTSSEPVNFTVSVRALDTLASGLNLFYVVRDLLGNPVDSGSQAVSLSGTNPLDIPISPKIPQPGVFSLEVKLASSQGTLEKSGYFAKLQPLENPFAFYRKQDIPEIKKRIAKYAVLFKRYHEFLVRDCGQKGFLGDFAVPLLNPEYGDPLRAMQRWRGVVCQFASQFVAPQGDRRLQEHMKPLLVRPPVLCGFDMAGDYGFFGAEAVALDMASSGALPEAGREMANLLETWSHDLEHISLCFLLAKEPLDAHRRDVLLAHMNQLTNAVRYFESHRSYRGGNLWHGTRTGCECRSHSTARVLLYYGNFFNEKWLLERYFGGLYTHYDYAMPRYDNQHVFDSGLRIGGVSGDPRPGPGDHPMLWTAQGLSRNPLEQHMNRPLAELIEKLNGPLPNEGGAVDELLGRGSNVALPMLLALGWYDPAAPETAWEELPPSAVFDVEGTVAMKSDWSAKMTDIVFTCGPRDTTYRDRPTHFQVFKAGDCILGSAAREGDDGNQVPSWGNVVAVGDRWPEFWNGNNMYPRINERIIMDRGAHELLSYCVRDRRLRKMMVTDQDKIRFYGLQQLPLELNFHGHTLHPYIGEGTILAYETSPEYDYVAGDATNVWPVDSVEEMCRQFVFVRPDVIVFYDRCVLGANPEKTKLLLYPGAQVTTSGKTFAIRNKSAYGAGSVLLPEDCTVNNKIEIVSASVLKNVEYLVVLKVGTGEPVPIAPKLIVEGGAVGAEFNYDGRDVRVLFDRAGPVRGRIAIKGGATAASREFAKGIEDTFSRWNRDPNYQKWMTQERFRFVVNKTEKQKAGE